MGSPKAVSPKLCRRYLTCLLFGLEKFQPMHVDGCRFWPSPNSLSKWRQVHCWNDSLEGCNHFFRCLSRGESSFYKPPSCANLNSNKIITAWVLLYRQRNNSNSIPSRDKNNKIGIPQTLLQAASRHGCLPFFLPSAWQASQLEFANELNFQMVNHNFFTWLVSIVHRVHCRLLTLKRYNVWLEVKYDTSWPPENSPISMPPHASHCLTFMQVNFASSVCLF